ncbi:MAG: RagB/SusD family nutrient uptake outer membrane protein [Rikenellaceae bacterium]
MKKIIILMVMSLSLTSCEFLEQDPEQLNTIEKVFTNRTSLYQWYACLFSDDYILDYLNAGMFYYPFNNSTDDAACLMDSPATVITQGQLSPSSLSSNLFPVYYQGIRHANIFLENIDQCTDLTESETSQLIAEARFMRAMYHFWLFQLYGPIPIVEQSYDVSSDTHLPARNTVEECTEWICGEFEWAAENGLRSELIANAYGFPTKWVAKAMKARMLLLVASPLYNGNTSYSGWTNDDGTVLMPQKYDVEKWKLAADAALEVITESPHALKKVALHDDGSDITFDEYVENFQTVTTEWSDETIWGKPSNTFWWTPSCLPGCVAGWNGRTSMTLELAAAYSMADGTSGLDMDEYFANPTFSTAPGDGTDTDTFSMFVGREARFYASVHFPNQVISYAPSAHPDATYNIGFWYAGNSGLSVCSGDIPFTGLTPRKCIPLSATSYKNESVETSIIPYPLIRLAEVYLIYCEAMNEYSGEDSHSSITTYLDELRGRSGLPALNTSLSKSDMREFIRNERRIELSWEMARFYDVRRWFIAHGTDGVFNQPVHGFDLMEGESATDLAFFQKTEIQSRTFRIEHYFFPIESSECAYNTNLVQAPFY